MAKITDPDLLILDTEITIDTGSYQITLIEAGNLTAADGVTLQAVYSFLKEQWRTNADFIPHPFPIVAITEESMEVGDTWDWGDATTKTYIRDGGWSLKSGSTSNEEYMNVTTLGTFVGGVSDQAYYQQSSSQNATQSMVYPDAVNEAVRIYANETSYPSEGFDYRGYFYIYLREYAKSYASYDLPTEQNLTTLTYKKYAMPLSNATDIKITHDDPQMTGSTYTGVTITYYSASQAQTIGANDYEFTTIIDANNQLAEIVYEKVQFQLRQYYDINDTGSGVFADPVTGSVATEMLTFVGDTLRTSAGVYITNFAVADTNRLEFTPTGSDSQVTYPYVASGELSFNDNLSTDATSKYWMFYTSVPSGAFGNSSSVIVEDNNDLPITGSVADDTGSYGTVAFSYDYDNNIQGGRTEATDASVTVVAIGLATAQYVKTTSAIARSTANTISLVSALERNYSNP